MYNSEFKTRFIKERVNSIGVEHIASAFFNRAAVFEEEYGKDLATFNVDQMQKLFDSFTRLSHTSVIQYKNVYSRYVEYAKQHDDSVEDQSGSINLEFVGAAEKMCGSPLHLQMLLDRRFLPPSAKGVDNVFRAYYWFAYIGIREADAVNLTSPDVDLRGMVVRVDGVAYRIYDEAAEAISNSVLLKAFEVSSSMNGTRYTRILKRADGDLVLRSTLHNAGTAQWRKQLVQHHPLGVREVEFKFEYGHIWRAGYYFRMYQREMAGIPVDFTDLAELYLQGRTFSEKSSYNRPKQVRRYKNDQFVEEYRVWKEMFGF